MMDLFVVEIQQESLRLDNDIIMESLTESNNQPNSFFSFSYYIKGKILQIFLNIIYKLFKVNYKRI